jgi:hypothetical protein
MVTRLAAGQVQVQVTVDAAVAVVDAPRREPLLGRIAPEPLSGPVTTR